jgi:hypothetical protein
MEELPPPSYEEATADSEYKLIPPELPEPREPLEKAPEITERSALTNDFLQARIDKLKKENERANEKIIKEQRYSNNLIKERNRDIQNQYQERNNRSYDVNHYYRWGLNLIPSYYTSRGILEHEINRIIRRKIEDGASEALIKDAVKKAIDEKVSEDEYKLEPQTKADKPARKKTSKKKSAKKKTSKKKSARRKSKKSRR